VQAAQARAGVGASRGQARAGGGGSARGRRRASGRGKWWLNAAQEARSAGRGRHRGLSGSGQACRQRRVMGPGASGGRRWKQEQTRREREQVMQFGRAGVARARQVPEWGTRAGRNRCWSEQ
jgi:hypothetical protein